MLTRWFDWSELNWGRQMAELEALRRELSRQQTDTAEERPRAASPASFPRIGLFDAKERLVLLAEVPGVTENDIEITMDEGMLTLRGTRRVEIPEGYGVHRQERSETTFARSFSLPCKVDADNAQASIKNGVLTLRLPKAPEVQPRQISVTAG